MEINTRSVRTAALAAVLAASAPALYSQASAQQGAPAAASSGAIQRRAAPPARILEFRVQPASIKPGESATLIWAAENSTGTTIDPGVGRAAPRGSKLVKPPGTTTYTLTVTGPNGTETRSVTLTVAGTTSVAAKPADQTAQRDTPRMSDGKPDLTGVYNTAAGAPGAPAAAPAANTPPRTPSLKPGAEKFKVVRAADDAGQYAECNPPGIPQTFMVPYPIQIVQSARYVVILHEYLHLFRIIPIDGTPHPVDPDPTWMGDAVGHFEGDTLVVDSVGYNDKTEINGYRHTEALHVVERFRRTDLNTLQYEAVIEDPNVFTGPWLVSRTFALRPEFDKIDEFVCENNHVDEYKALFDKK